MTTPAPTPDRIVPPAPDPELITRRLVAGRKITPSDELLQLAQDALDDATGEVEGYLGRPILPEQRTAYNVFPINGGWRIREFEPIRAIVSTTPTTDPAGMPGSSTVLYTVGIDYRIDPECSPIRRYITAAALNNYLLLQYAENVLHLRGPVNSISVSTEGQSKNVQFGHLGYLPPSSRSASQGMDYPGQLPKLTTLDRWRRAGRRVTQASDRWYDVREWSRDGYVRGVGGYGPGELPAGYSGGVPGSSTPQDWGFPDDGYRW